MSNIDKVSDFLSEAGTFAFLTSVDGQPKGRPFGFFLPEGDRIYFATGTFKDCFKQLVANPKVEVLAFAGSRLMRYDGEAVVVDDSAVLEKVRAAAPQLTAMYDQNGFEFGIFYLKNAHVQFRTMNATDEEFDL